MGSFTVVTTLILLRVELPWTPGGISCARVHAGCRDEAASRRTCCRRECRWTSRRTQQL